MLKKTIAGLLALILLLSACAREQSPPPESAPPESTASQSAAQPDDGLFHGGDAAAYLREHLPVMDGSTSLIPLEAGLRAALFGISMEEAALAVTHTSTWGSFDNLLGGRADLIFSCPLSEQQYERAAFMEVELEAVPVAMEGFVFVVNAKNPVDSLTQEQLRGIYSGKITNWREVGGNDAPIVPYQRNYDSGSQNYMITFMGDTPLMEAPTERRPGTMAGLMDVIAVNDNAENAIGYSVYAYAADMYGSGDDIKFIAVDGVAPDKKTMAAGGYPLLGYNYAVFRADAPENGNVRTLTNWLTSYEGQLAVAQAGYVTLEDIGFDYQSMTLEKYQGVGVGGQNPGALPSYEYTTGYNLPLEAAALPDGTPSYRLSCLADKTLQAEINAYIDAQIANAKEKSGAFTGVVDRLNAGYEYEMFSVNVVWPYSRDDEKTPPAAVFVTAKNGCLSVAVTQCYIYQVQDGYDRYYSTETASWDLLSGKRLAPEELFCDGVDVDEVLNAYLREKSQSPMDSWGIYYEMKSDFGGLTLSGWHLTHDAVYIDDQNPYFGYGVRISLEELPEGVLASEQARDMSACFDSADVKVRKAFRTTRKNNVYQYLEEDFLAYALLDERAYPTAAKINAAVEAHLNAYYTKAAVVGYYDGQGVMQEEDMELFWMDWWLTDYGGRYAVFSGRQPAVWNDSRTAIANYYPHRSVMVFDLATGEELGWQALLLDGWETHCRSEYGNDGADYGGLQLSEIYQTSDGEFYLHLTGIDTGESCGVYIPQDYIRW